MASRVKPEAHTMTLRVPSAGIAKLLRAVDNPKEPTAKLRALMSGSSLKKAVARA